MEYLQRAILNKHKQHWHTLRDAGFIKNLNKEVVSEIEDVYKSEIDANFFVNKWCMSCVAEMINTLYIVTKFDTEIDDAIIKTETREFMEAIELDEAKQELEEVFIEKPAKRKYKKRK
ncbi:hypothetical protein UFOVP384_38 [uncultured Caudovirales phage]|uniref:Uncharacterized protein n=1 Tax=uncultured Caudovirales phage TaxID=2100421 RepID=A0A6J7X510_9CAUD|nr:hypothetical protein UFOVP384_38 [uncultured Caudovirales phage]